MQKSDIKAGTEYALREKRTLGTPFQRVRVIEHVRRNKWKVEWIDPNPGLVDYVESRTTDRCMEGPEGSIKGRSERATP
jgi:hypothetical protein